VVQRRAFGEARPHVGVHGQIPLRMQATHLLVDAAPPERRGLREVVEARS
jgi:hypothetical protein